MQAYVCLFRSRSGHTVFNGAYPKLSVLGLKAKQEEYLL